LLDSLLQERMTSLVTKLLPHCKLLRIHLPSPSVDVIRRLIRTDEASFNFSYTPVNFKEPQNNKSETNQPRRKNSYLPKFTLRRQLNQHPEKIARLLNLSENENLSSIQYMRCGNRGSLCITREKIDDTSKGVWYNFESNESGDMFDLIKKVKNFSTERELQSFIVRNILPNIQNENQKVSDDTNSDTEKKLQDKKTKVNAYVAKIISGLKPLKGTPAEVYLQKTRKLKRIPETKSLQFHQDLSTRAKDGSWLTGIPGLVALASHCRGDSGNVQITYLDSRTYDKHPNVQLNRRTLGTFHGPQGQHYCEIVARTNQDYSFLCEGVETALSVYQAFPDIHLIATLGKNNFPRMDHSVLNKKVVLVMDNDGLDLRSDKLFSDTVKMLMENDKEVFYVLPPLVDGHDKTDMNDILVHHGESAVHEIVLNRIKKIKM